MTTATAASQPSTLDNSRTRSRSAANAALWTIQVLLAMLFLFAGSMKFVMPIETMTRQTSLPALFFRFIGVAEMLGGIGLVLPWALRIRRELTPLAATGLLIIMSGATTLTLRTGGIAQAALPFCVGILLIVVAYGRWSALRSPGQAQ